MASETIAVFSYTACKQCLNKSFGLPHRLSGKDGTGRRRKLRAIVAMVAPAVRFPTRLARELERRVGVPHAYCRPGGGDHGHLVVVE